MSMTLTKIKALKPDVLIISGHEKGALTAIPQIDALKFYLPILAMTHCGSAQIAEKLGLAAEYAFCTSMVRVGSHVFGSAGDFAKAFKGAHRYQPCMSMPMRSSGRRASIPKRSPTRSPRPTF